VLYRIRVGNPTGPLAMDRGGMPAPTVSLPLPSWSVADVARGSPAADSIIG
jgi:hypothetical protein